MDPGGNFRFTIYRLRLIILITQFYLFYVHVIVALEIRTSMHAGSVNVIINVFYKRIIDSSNRSDSSVRHRWSSDTKSIIFSCNGTNYPSNYLICRSDVVVTEIFL